MQCVEGSYADGQQMLAAEVVSSLLVVIASQPVLLAAVLLPVQNRLQLADFRTMEMPQKLWSATDCYMFGLLLVCNGVSHLQLTR